MVDRIQKLLNKMSAKGREELQIIVRDIVDGDVAFYDVKKLKGYQNVYRIRKGKFRLIYSRDEYGKNIILSIERRSDTTYSIF